MVAEEIALENKEKGSKAVIESNKTRTNSNCVQMDACEKSPRDRSTNTREQVDKMSGVGTGTVARYNRVMNSDVLMDRFVQMLSNGEIGESAKKVGKRIKELERIYGIDHGGDRKTSNPKVSDLNQSDIAEMIGISVDTLNNYKKLTELIPELEDLVDTGIVTKLYRIVTKKYIYLFEQYICDTLKSCMRRFGR